MSSPRETLELRIGGAVLLLLFGAWAGFRLHTAITPVTPPALPTPPAQSPSGTAPPVTAVRVPVGEASPPSQSDVDAFDSMTPPPGKIPDKLPQFSLHDGAGKATSISEWSGKSLVLNFWATWCAPCRREIPLLESVSNEWAAREVTVVGVAVDHAPQVLKFAREFKIAYPLLIGEQDALDAAALLGMDSPVFPFTVFTDRRGEVVALFVGELHKRQAELILEIVSKLNEQRLQLTAARRVIAEGIRALQSDDTDEPPSARADAGTGARAGPSPAD